MKCGGVSGELVVQGKPRPVSSQGEKKKRGERMEDGGKEGKQKWLVEGGWVGWEGGTEKGPLSVLNKSRRTFFLPPPVVLSNSISTEEQ